MNQQGLFASDMPGPMSATRCVEVVRTESAQLADAATGALEAQVPRYPEWNVADLLIHTGIIHEWVYRILRDRATERPARSDPPDWHGDRTILLEWFRQGAARLSEALESADPEDRVWSFTSDQTVGFWLRRMAHETATHRWDAESARGGDDGPHGFPDDLAASGIRESLEMHLPKGDPELGGNNERLALLEGGSNTGRPGRLLAVLTLERESVSWEPASRPAAGGDPVADATARGSLTALWLLLTGRRFGAAIEVEGSQTVYSRFVSAVDRVGVPSKPSR
ncbi:maleylpyruvate isomerase family mycothiol-dependent enzyme [Salinispira pacifica]